MNTVADALDCEITQDKAGRCKDEVAAQKTRRLTPRDDRSVLKGEMND